MKIAIFVDKFPVLSQTFVLNQITGLIDLGCEVTILALNKGDLTKRHPDVDHYNLIEKTIYLVDEPIKQLPKLINRLYYLLKGLMNPSKHSITRKSFNNEFGHQGKSLLLSTILNKNQKEMNFDVILCHFGYNGILANKLRELGALKGKIATVFHGNEITDFYALRRYSLDYQSLFKNTELMLPISQLWRNRIVELGCEEKKIKVHRMGIDLNKFLFCSTHNTLAPNDKSRKLFTRHSVTIFTVARFSEKKGIEFAIKALTFLPKNIKVKYILAGFGELETHLKILVEELNLKGIVNFIGAIDQQQINEYMKLSDIFLQPSITASNGDMEGIPVAIMEAMAAGLPVISTRHSGIPELIEHEKSGLLANEKDSASIAKNIRLLIENPKISNSIRINARKKVEQISDIKLLNKSLLKILNNLFVK